MNTVGIVGAGTMGTGISHVAALAEHKVFLYDVSDEILTRALKRISSELSTSVEKHKLTSQAAEAAAMKIRPTSAFEDLSACDWIIEAAPERLDTKHDIFKRLEAICSPATVLATNTSSLSITRIAAPLKYPKRVLGMHFFNPAHLMKLVEIVRGRRTAPETIERAVGFARELGKIPVVSGDNPGFIVNRVARPFYGEALRLLGEGIATVEDIDRIVKLEGGFKMGPFELMDLIGIDVNFAVTQSIYEQTFGEPRYRPHIIQQTMVSAGFLGRKTKRGFYRYD